MSEVDKLFSPSHWTKRYPQEVCENKFLETSAKISGEVSNKIPCVLNVPYGQEERDRYDIFGTDLPDDAPILIFIHGGYWQCKEVTKEISRYPVKSLHKLGIKTIILEYVQCPEFSVFEINEKVSGALKKILDYATECGSKSIGIAGHSAGAQISIVSTLNLFATLERAQRELFTGIFLLGGVLDLTELVGTKYNEALGLKTEEAEELSPMFRKFEAFSLKNLKVFICVGGCDCPGLIGQSRGFYEVLMGQGLGKRVELLVFEALDHFDIVEKLDEDDFRIVKIIARMLLTD